MTQMGAKQELGFESPGLFESQKSLKVGAPPPRFVAPKIRRIPPLLANYATASRDLFRPISTGASSNSRPLGGARDGRTRYHGRDR
jgi:hypothetical protein